ncbi:MAG: hypothetical protein HQL76_06310 [Magnetococcales bacterium]|nr:hypothetical protein [Magnetococcales bacterium]
MMGEVSANLHLDVHSPSSDQDSLSFAQDPVFELVVDGTDQEGNKPVTIEHKCNAVVSMSVWLQYTWNRPPNGFEALKMLTPGQKRVKVFCPKAMDKAVKIYVDNSRESVRSMGRRNDPVTETLTWSGEVWKPLRYPYDNPEATIIERTVFRDRKGNRVAEPKYDRRRCGYATAMEAIGALVVQYAPGYSLFQIEYDTGKQVASRELFEEMKKCWISGDIGKASVPPVRLVAISDRAAVSAQFERSFWPKGFPKVRIIFPEEVRSKNMFIENQGTRETVTEMIPLNADDPETLYGVKKTTSIEGENEDGEKFYFRFLNP